MSFAIHLFFDADTETSIHAVWKELSDSGLAPYLYQSANRPHLTLAIYQEMDQNLAKTRLETLAEKIGPLHLSFQSFGIFSLPQAAVFLGPTVTNSLLELHTKTHQVFGEFSRQPEPYYLPGNWIPHCALALEINFEAIQPVMEIGMRLLKLPLEGQITEIGLVGFRPMVHLCTYSLGNQTLMNFNKQVR